MPVVIDENEVKSINNVTEFPSNKLNLIRQKEIDDNIYTLTFYLYKECYPFDKIIKSDI